MTIEPMDHKYKTVTDLPPLPATYAWHIVEAHHHHGVTWWLRLEDSLGIKIDVHGWKTGYVPTSDQLIRRATTMMKRNNVRMTP